MVRYRRFPNGFTLIELVIVVSLIGVLFGLTFVSYRNFSDRQAMKAAVGQLRDTLEFAKSRADSQVKPQVCILNGYTLDGYKVQLCNLGDACSLSGDYEIRVVCSGTSYPVDSVTSFRKLPDKISFNKEKTKPTSFFFKVLSRGVDQPGTIDLEGLGREAIIQIDGLGNITTSGL